MAVSRVQRSDPISVWPLGAALLEGPVWDIDTQALWFVDIKGQRIHRYRPRDRNRASWQAPGQCGFCLPASNGKWVAGLQNGLHYFDPSTGHFTPRLDPEPDQPGNRLNDAAVDPTGRLWFGTMDNAEAAGTGRIYCWHGHGDCVASTDPVVITNGPAFSPDGRILYHVDTLGGIVHAATVRADGTLTDPRIFARIPAEAGYPDGPCVDAEGCVWIGLYNGWGARRYSPGGELLETIRFRVSAVTKLAFGGPNLCTLYATTARKHVPPSRLATEPQAGDLFALEVSVPGLAGHKIQLTG